MSDKLDMKTLSGEATAYDKKQMLEARRPKSWLKSVSAFLLYDSPVFSAHAGTVWI